MMRIKGLILAFVLAAMIIALCSKCTNDHAQNAPPKSHWFGLSSSKAKKVGQSERIEAGTDSTIPLSKAKQLLGPNRSGARARTTTAWRVRAS